MRLPSPVLMAPIGVIGLCAQDGHSEPATAAAAARTGVPMIASTLSADSLEDVAAQFGGTPSFFQLYTPLLVKGICHPDDARRAKDGGVDGIYCSTHGAPVPT